MSNGAVRTCSWASAMFLVLTPTPAIAQTHLPELKANETIWVTTSDGQTEQGRFLAWSDSALEWAAASGVSRTPLDAIEGIETPDPIRDGVITGLVIGAGFGAGLGLLLSSGSDCKTQCGKDKAEASLAGAVVGAGEGALFGLLFDWAVHKRQLVYARSAAHARAVFTPIVGSGRYGAVTRVQW